MNFLDSADAYNGGSEEEIAGRAIGNRRHDWVVATKLANPMGEGAEPRRAVAQMGDAGRARTACAGSAPTTSTSITCTRRTTRRRSPKRVRAVGDLLRSRQDPLLRRLATIASWRVAEICPIICDRMGIDRPIV